MTGTALAAAPGSSTPPWRLNRVIVNDIDVGDTGIDVPPNATIENVYVEMTNHSNEASGRVTDGDGNIVRDCYVIVFAQDPARWTVQTRYLERRPSRTRRSVPRPAARGRLLRRGDDRRRGQRVDRSRVPRAGSRARDEILDCRRREEDARPPAFSGAGVLKRLARSVCHEPVPALFSVLLICAASAAAQTVTTFTTVPPGAAPQPPGQPGQPANSSEQPPPGTATLRGHVFAADSGQPLRKAQVRIFAGEIRENRMATTDANGSYEFTEVRAGRYTISASKGSYVNVSYGQQRPTDAPKPLEILDNQTVERVDLTLPRGSVVTGRIVDEYGEPAPEIQVAAQRYQFINGQRRLVPAGRMADHERHRRVQALRHPARAVPTCRRRGETRTR